MLAATPPKFARSPYEFGVGVSLVWLRNLLKKIIKKRIFVP
jgi:hypothetical protein